MAPICFGCVWPSVSCSLPREDSGNGFPASIDCDTLRLLQSLPSSQIGQGNRIKQAAPDCDSDVEASLLRSTGSNIGICHHSHDARICLDEASGPLPFFACGDERAPLCVCDVRIQHRRENKSAGCASTQDVYRFPADTISDIAARKIWSEHLLNPVESDVSGIGTCSVCCQLTHQERMRESNVCWWSLVSCRLIAAEELSQFVCQ